MARVRECALQNVSGLAVLDDKATLMGTLSIRDLKVGPHSLAWRGLVIFLPWPRGLPVPVPPG